MIGGAGAERRHIALAACELLQREVCLLLLYFVLFCFVLFCFVLFVCVCVCVSCFIFGVTFCAWLVLSVDSLFNIHFLARFAGPNRVFF